MNEEFATLKGMIPACTDQEMHKLAILQVCRVSGTLSETVTDDEKGEHRLLAVP